MNRRNQGFAAGVMFWQKAICIDDIHSEIERIKKRLQNINLNSDINKGYYDYHAGKLEALQNVL